MARKNKNTRAARKAELQHAASQVVLPADCDICVVGGGAAGLVAAIVAGEQGASVVVLERDLECGRTILATGNGRCNFTNRNLNPKLYNEPAFVASSCGTTWLNDVLTFFKGCGLAWEEEAEGRLYPLSRQAASVRNVLLARAKKAGVILAPAHEAIQICKDGKGFVILADRHWRGAGQRKIRSSAIVFANGHAVSHVEQELGLSGNPSVPMLCPLACDEIPYNKQLDGRRVRASAMLIRNSETVAREQGEILFRSYGLSGIAIFNLSRYAHPGDIIRLDLLPNITLEDALPLAQINLDGLLDPVLAEVLMSETNDPKRAVALAKSFDLTVDGLADTDHAQIHRGGFTPSHFDPATLESRDIPRFFVCGEAMDVDGPCGGFNLAWAWKSGMIAGAAAAIKVAR